MKTERRRLPHSWTSQDFNEIAYVLHMMRDLTAAQIAENADVLKDDTIIACEALERIRRAIDD